MSQTDIVRIENSMKAAEKTTELGEALARLRSNRDFKRIVLEGYFKDEAVRLVQAKALPNLQSGASQADLIRQIDAIGSLQEYFRTVDYMADQARKELVSGQQEIEEILREGDEA